MPTGYNKVSNQYSWKDELEKIFYNFQFSIREECTYDFLSVMSRYVKWGQMLEAEAKARSSRPRPGAWGRGRGKMLKYEITMERITLIFTNSPAILFSGCPCVRPWSFTNFVNTMSYTCANK